jgi:hypothetical protein
MKAAVDAGGPLDEPAAAASDRDVPQVDGAVPERQPPSPAAAKKGRTKKAAPASAGTETAEPYIDAPAAAPTKARRAKKAPPAAPSDPSGDRSAESVVEPAAENAASIDAAPARSTGRRRASTRPRA